MKTKNQEKGEKIDIKTVINHFKRNIFENKPSYNEIIKEVQLMGYKIKPIIGNVSSLNFKNREFIEILWNLGKMEEFFNKILPKLNKEDKRIFIKIFNEMYQKTEKKLNKIKLKSISSKQRELLIEMQIYRNISSKKKTIN